MTTTTTITLPTADQVTLENVPLDNGDLLLIQRFFLNNVNVATNNIYYHTHDIPPEDPNEPFKTNWIAYKIEIIDIEGTGSTVVS